MRDELLPACVLPHISPEWESVHVAGQEERHSYQHEGERATRDGHLGGCRLMRDVLLRAFLKHKRK